MKRKYSVLEEIKKIDYPDNLILKKNDKILVDDRIFSSIYFTNFKCTTTNILHYSSKFICFVFESSQGRKIFDNVTIYLCRNKEHSMWDYDDHHSCNHCNRKMLYCKRCHTDNFWKFCECIRDCKKLICMNCLVETKKNQNVKNIQILQDVFYSEKQCFKDVIIKKLPIEIFNYILSFIPTESVFICKSCDKNYIFCDNHCCRNYFPLQNLLPKYFWERKELRDKKQHYNTAFNNLLTQHSFQDKIYTNIECCIKYFTTHKSEFYEKVDNYCK